MADDYQLVPVDHDPMGFVPVDHDPFAAAAERTRRAAIHERDPSQPRSGLADYAENMGNQIWSDVKGLPAELYRHPENFIGPGEIGAPLMGAMRSVGALGGKPGLMAAASKAVPMGEGIATSAPRAHPAEDSRLAKNLMFGLTGEKTSPEYQGAKEWLKATQADRQAREEVQNKVLSMTSEELRNTPEWRDYLARRGEVAASGIKLIPVDHDPFKK